MRAGHAFGTGLCSATLAWAFAMLTGCAGLPRDVQRVPSQAIAASRRHRARPHRARLVAGPRAERLSAAVVVGAVAAGAHRAGAARAGVARRAVLPDPRRRDRPLPAARAARRGPARRARAAAGGRPVHRRQRRAAARPGGPPQRRGAAVQPVSVGAQQPRRTRSPASLFDFGRVNHRMHNKLFIADGAMAVAGGRNIGNEYFMEHGRAPTSSTSTRSPSARWWRSSRPVRPYWNSEHVYPVRVVAPPDRSDAELRERFERWTDPERSPPPAPAPRAPTTCSASATSKRTSAEGRLDLIWARPRRMPMRPTRCSTTSAAGCLACGATTTACATT